MPRGGRGCFSRSHGSCDRRYVRRATAAWGIRLIFRDPTTLRLAEPHTVVAEDARPQPLRWIHEVAAIERSSASAGERRAAEWVLAQLPDSAARARIESERAHGTHLPFALPSAVALAAGFARSRFLA